MDDGKLLGRLFNELARLEARYDGEPAAIEALEAVKYWAIEESVETMPTLII